MNLNENPELQRVMNQAISGWEMKNFAVLNKASIAQVNSLKGSLRLRSHEAVTIKIISFESIQSNDAALAKVIKYAKSGLLGGMKEDGTLLFHEEIAKHLNDNQTVIIKDKATSKVDTRQITVEAISDVNYKLIQAVLAALLPNSATPETEKEHKIKASESKPSQARVTTRSPSPNQNTAIKQMETKLNQITTMQEQRSKEAREKKKAEEKELKRRDEEHKDIRKEGLKWDIKQENIKKEATRIGVQKHDKKKT
jgi:hypothetical protein